MSTKPIDSVACPSMFGFFALPSAPRQRFVARYTPTCGYRIGQACESVLAFGQRLIPGHLYLSQPRISPSGNVYVPAKTHPSSSRVHCRLLPPERDKPPAHYRQQRFVIGNMDHIYLLRRGDIVARLNVLSCPGQVIKVPDFLPRIAFGETTAHRGRQFDTVCSGRQDLPRGPVIYRAFTTGENLATHGPTIAGKQTSDVR